MMNHRALLAAALSCAACSTPPAVPVVETSAGRSDARPEPEVRDPRPRCPQGQVRSRSAGCIRVVELSVGSDHGCVRTEDGRVLCWGRNSRGELGNGTVQHDHRAVLVPEIHDAASLTAYGGRTCVVRRSGRVACWGSNYWGESDGSRHHVELPPDAPRALTDETDPDFDIHNWRPRPSVVEGVESAVRVVMGYKHSCALLRDGGIYCWGRSDPHFATFADSHHGGFQSRRLSLPAAAQLESGHLQLCSIGRDDHAVRCWGNNEHGQLGDSDPSQAPRVVALSKPAKRLFMLGARTCAQHDDDTLSCWGAARGLCGFEAFVDPVAAAAAVGKVKTIVGGGCDFALLRSDGSVEYYSNEAIAKHGAPRRMPLSDVVQLSSNGDFTCALQADSTVWCWGLSWLGSAGIPHVDSVSGTPVDPPVPIQL